jgi:hypothetical protein
MITIEDLIEDAEEMRDDAAKDMAEQKDLLADFEQEVQILRRLRGIETAAEAYALDILKDFKFSSIHCPLLRALVEAVMPAEKRQVPVPPAPASPEPGDRYRWTGTTTDFAPSWRSGDTVTLLYRRHGSQWFMRNERSKHEDYFTLSDPIYGFERVEDPTTSSPTAPTAPAAPAPAGTLITKFTDLRAGDKVRIEGRYCGTQVATLDKLRPVPYWIMSVHEGSQGADCLDETEFPRLKVYLLKRKPYVKDGRWVARAGDKFRSNADEDVVGTVKGFNSVGDATLEGHGTGGFLLLQSNWTPVEDA